MAEGKKSFVLYCDYIGTFEHLSDEEAGQLIKHIFRYVNDQSPASNNRIINICFEPIKQQLKRDLREWEQKVRGFKKAGKKGGIKSGESRRSKNKRSHPSKNEANEADNVTVTVNDTVNVIDISNTLTDHEIGKTIEFCSITLQREYTSARVTELWKAFLINGQKKFHSLPEKIKHFRNWIKTQPYESHKPINTGGAKTKLGTSEARTEALKKWGFGGSVE